jgi:hypothetical protein
MAASNTPASKAGLCRSARRWLARKEEVIDPAPDVDPHHHLDRGASAI